MKSKSTSARFLEYKNILKKLKALGFSRVFSSNLADTLGVSASLVRKNFLMLKTEGNRRGGYQIDELLNEINTLLRKDEVTRAVIVGLGKLGGALLSYAGFREENIEFAAAFDIDREKLEQEYPIPVYHLDDMPEFIAANKIKIGVLAVPGEVVQRVADIMVLSGVEGFFNFAPNRLVLPAGRFENQINLALELEKLILRVGDARNND